MYYSLIYTYMYMNIVMLIRFSYIIACIISEFVPGLLSCLSGLVG